MQTVVLTGCWVRIQVITVTLGVLIPRQHLTRRCATHLLAHRLPLIRRSALVASRWRVAPVFMPLVLGCLSRTVRVAVLTGIALVALLLLWRSGGDRLAAPRVVVPFRLGLVKIVVLVLTLFGHRVSPS